jgi:hypothetical protein
MNGSLSTEVPRTVLRFGVVAALTTTGLTAVTFVLALTALPDEVPYPFATDHIAAQWPGDYLWMVPAMLLLLSFVAMLAAVHEAAPPDRRVFSLVGLCVGALAAGVLLVDYYLQATVLPVSLEKGQLDGWALLTQYNPNGIFIALEELGYLLMSLALAALAPVFGARSGLERTLRWALAGNLAAVVLAFVAVSVVRGPDRGTAFEIAVITLVWLTLLLTCPLLAVVLRRAAASRSIVGAHPGGAR